MWEIRSKKPLKKPHFLRYLRSLHVLLIELNLQRVHAGGLAVIHQRIRAVAGRPVAKGALFGENGCSESVKGAKMAVSTIGNRAAVTC